MATQSRWSPCLRVVQVLKLEPHVSTGKPSHHGRTDSSSVGRAMENKKADFHFAVRGLRCES